MLYANKKVSAKANTAQQTAKIIANVKTLEEKNVIRLETDTVLLYPTIWKDKPTALNWMSCLHQYYCMKKQFKSTDTLFFKNIETNELVGSAIGKKAKVLIFD